MIKEKLNEAYETDQMTEAIFEFRAQVENAYNVLNEAITRIDEIAQSVSFKDVDPEIKSEGQSIRQILNDVKKALDSHAEFISWVQPK